MSEKCLLAGVCSGCGWIDQPYDVQKQNKLNTFKGLLITAGLTELPTIEFEGGHEMRLRDRVDLTLENGQLGLYHIDRSGIVDLAACPMLSCELERWLQEFRKNLPPKIKKGSIRLRVSPSGMRGVWLDLANLDVKDLFDDGEWLRSLLEIGAVVEIGQRRKRLIIQDGNLKLKDPQPETWFETYLPDPVPLWSFVGGFTQPGFISNRQLVTTTLNAVRAAHVRSWMELGSGIGNFTLPLARVAERVDALELDELSVQALAKNVAAQSNINVIRGDYRHKRVFEQIGSAEGILCDPPRSGLGSFLDFLPEFSKNREIVYVSCFADSFAADAKRLVEQGYKLKSLVLVDQFPQTPHVESVARFSRTV